jgi:hypothetical protein
MKAIPTIPTNGTYQLRKWKLVKVMQKDVCQNEMKPILSNNLSYNKLVLALKLIDYVEKW